MIPPNRCLRPACPVLFLLFFPLVLATESSAQQDLEEIVITASGGFEQDLFALPWSAEVLGGDRLRDTSRTFSEALTGLPSVMVQKTAYGMSSPYLRGLTGYHNVLLVDGVRLNHSAMRSGPNQYWSTVDMLGLDRVELLRGPHGVIYGSDAVGGVVHAVAPPTRYSLPGEGVAGGGRVYARWSAAESSATLRFEGEIHDQDWSLRVGQTLATYGDLRGGSEVGTQDDTGYDLAATDLHLARRLASGAELALGVQSVKLDDVPRTHKTLAGLDWEGLKPGKELFRRHDQKRRLYYLRSSWRDAGGWADRAELTLSLHEHDETRERMKANADGTSKDGDFQGFGINDLGLTARFEADGGWNDRWSYGIELHREGADSFKRKFDANRVFTSTSIQGPIAADARYTTLAAYLQDEIFFDHAWSLVSGLRYTRVDVDVDRVEDPDSGLPTAFSRDFDSVVASLRALWRPAERQSWFAGLSQGFRAPSLYDLTSLDETSVIDTPDFNLEPEHFLQAELGGRGEAGDWSWNTSLYQTWISDMIVRSPENPTGSEVLKDNGDGWIRGLEASLAYAWSTDWSTQLMTSWMDGEVDQRLPAPGFARVRRPIDRLMPLQAYLTTRYAPHGSRWWAEAYWWLVDGQSDLSLRDERDTTRIPDRDGDGFADGTPGFAILGLRAGWQFGQASALTVALENLGDVDYRIHGSGVNGAGLDLVVGLDLRF